VIRHVVLFALAAEDQEQKRRDAEEMRARMAPLATLIPGVLSMEIGVDLGRVPGHWDVVLVSEHESNAALEAYQADSRHREVIGFVDSVVRAKACVDHVLDGTGGRQA
jgi:Stress responsive A/B Barrel Domain